MLTSRRRACACPMIRGAQRPRCAESSESPEPMVYSVHCSTLSLSTQAPTRSTTVIPSGRPLDRDRGRKAGAAGSTRCVRCTSVAREKPMVSATSVRAASCGRGSPRISNGAIAQVLKIATISAGAFKGAQRTMGRSSPLNQAWSEPIACLSARGSPPTDPGQDGAAQV
jgi:hypothetical protein